MCHDTFRLFNSLRKFHGWIINGTPTYRTQTLHFHKTLAGYATADSTTRKRCSDGFNPARPTNRDC